MADHIFMQINVQAFITKINVTNFFIGDTFVRKFEGKDLIKMTYSLSCQNLGSTKLKKKDGNKKEKKERK